ncbi:murein biosynthesis integral membrane protein MurJ [Puniceicoccaceae bacterium K14]|nr:murein biosynthesis integral membrane protein MurJ [Puniceicoccaceae bacterium K14]
MSNLLSRIGVVSSLTMVSRVLGLGRDMLTSAVFGTSVWNSAFITAFTLPNLFRRLLGEGVLTAALMPSLSDEAEKGGDSAVFSLMNKTLSWLSVLCAGLIVLATLGFLYLGSLGMSQNWLLVAELGIVLFPYILFICVAAIISAALNLKGVFGIPAMTAVWLNASILAFLGLGAWSIGGDLEQQMRWLCSGVLVGGALQLLVPAIALWRLGWRPKIDFELSPEIRRVFLLAVPGIMGAAVYQINIMVSRVLANSVNEEGATLMYLANRLVELPVGVFTIAISTVVFPAFTAAISAKRFDEFHSTYRKGITLSTMMALPSALGLAILGEEIVRLLFERGRFDATATASLQPVLFAFALGLPFVSFVSIETRALYSLKQMKAPVKVATVALVLNFVLGIVFMRLWGVVGLAYANNLTIFAQAVLLHVALRKFQPDLHISSALKAISKCGLAASIMGVILYGAKHAISRADIELGLVAVIAVFVLIPFAVGVYFGALLLLKNEEASELVGMVRAKLPF